MKVPLPIAPVVLPPLAPIAAVPEPTFVLRPPPLVLPVQRSLFPKSPA